MLLKDLFIAESPMDFTKLSIKDLSAMLRTAELIGVDEIESDMIFVEYKGYSKNNHMYYVVSGSDAATMGGKMEYAVYDLSVYLGNNGVEADFGGAAIKDGFETEEDAIKFVKSK